MHKTHHPKDDVHRSYIKRKEGGRGLISLEECVENVIAGLHHYVQNSQERLISAAWRSSGEQEVTQPPIITKQRRQTKRKQDWKNKRLQGQFIRGTEDIADIKSWNWLRRECIKTNNIKTKIGGTRNDPRCRMCKANDETIIQIISLCLKPLQKEYKRRHDWMGNTVHWDICRKKDYDVPEKR